MGEEKLVKEIYERVYDDKSLGNNGFGGKYLGNFEVIQQVMEDGWTEVFVGRKIEDDQIYLIMSGEVTGFNSGSIYEVYPLYSLMLRK